MQLVREQRNNVFHSANTSCAITNESTDASTITPQSRAAFTILLSMCAATLVEHSKFLSLYTIKGHIPMETEKSTTHLILSFWRSTSRKSICQFLQNDILPATWWIDLYRPRQTSSASYGSASGSYQAHQRSGRRN